MTEDNIGTVGVVAGELAAALQPLEDHLTVGGILSLFRELGIELPEDLLGDDGIENSLSAARTAVQQLPDLVTALADSTSQGLVAILDALRDLLEALAAVFSALDSIATALKDVANQLPTPGDVIAFAELFVSRLLEYLVVLYLEGSFPRLAAFMALVGVIEIVPAQADSTDPTHPPYLRRGLRFDNLPKLLGTPEQFMRDEYQWGDAGFNGVLLLSRLADLLYAFAVPADFVPARAGKPTRLDVLLFSLSPETSPPPGAVPGLIAKLLLGLQDTFTLQFPFIVDGWNIEVAARGELEAGLVAVLRPPGTLSVQPPVGTLDGSVSIGVVGMRPDAAHPNAFQILRIPGVGRIEAGRVVARVGSEYHFDVVAGAATGDPFVELRMDDARLLFDAGDGFLQEVLPAGGANVPFTFGVGWSRTRGVFFTGSAGLEATLVIGAAIGPLQIDSLNVRASVEPEGLDLATSITGAVALGPVTASISEVGLLSRLAFSRGNLGPFDLDSKFKPPTGLGIAVNSGPVHGGGFISFDPDAGRYSGAVELSIYDISVKAFGLIETKVPGVSFSFVIVISAEFTPIQLGFGFTLNGVGGLVGINRTIASNELGKLVREGRSENLLFPKNLIANAPMIIRDLGTVFPARNDHYVFGPLGKFGWGTPTLITAQIGIILEIPGPVIVILGEVKVLLPKPSAPLVKMNMSVVGTLDFPNKTFSIDAALHDSIIQGYPISGQMALRVKWGDQPNFVASVGGFHPAYQPPKEFPKLQPMALDLGQHGSASITVSGFFAVTSNTVQVGGDARLHAGGSGISLDASVSVKALFVFSPFAFQANIDASVKISFHGYGPSVHLHGLLEGPSPWHIRGGVCVSILFWDACLGFDETFGGGQPEAIPELDPWEPGVPDIIGLKAALQEAGNWSGVLPAGTANVVSRAQGSETLVDPLGGLTVHQKAVPVETDQPISRFGVAKVKTPISYKLPPTGATIGVGPTLPLTKLSPVNDFFAPAQYFQMDDGKKLSAPGFEQQQSGYVFGENANNLRAGSNAGVTLKYQTFLIAGDGTISDAPEYEAPNAHVTGLNKRSPVALGGSAQVGTRRFIDRLITQAFDVLPPTFILSNNLSLTPITGLLAAVSRSSVLLSLDAYRLQKPEERLQVQVSASHELAV